MKRFTILLSVAALTVGGLTMTSCVKNEESQSVTDIRTAKVAQLHALATLAKAQAEAELISANSEKALNESKIAINKAKAAYQQALADGEAVKVETAKLALEKAKATHQLVIDKMVMDAQELKIQSEIALGLAEAALAENPKLAELVGLYETAVGDWNRENTKNVKLKASLSGLEVDLVSEKGAKAELIRLNEVDIAYNNAKIAAYKAYGTAQYDALKAEKTTVDVLVAEADLFEAGKFVDLTIAEDNVKDANRTATALTATANAKYIADTKNAVRDVADPAIVTIKLDAAEEVKRTEMTVDGVKTEFTGIPYSNRYEILDVLKPDALKTIADYVVSAQNQTYTEVQVKAAKLLIAAVGQANYLADVKAAKEAQIVLMSVSIDHQVATRNLEIYEARAGIIDNLLDPHNTIDVAAAIEAFEQENDVLKKENVNIGDIIDAEDLIAIAQNNIAVSDTKLAAIGQQIKSLEAAIKAEISE